MDKDVEFYANAKKTAPAYQQTTRKDLAKSEKPNSTSATIEQNNNSVSEPIVTAANNQEAVAKKEEAIQEPDLQNTSLKKQICRLLPYRPIKRKMLREICHDRI